MYANTSKRCAGQSLPIWARVTLLVLCLNLASSEHDCSYSKRGGPTLFSLESGISSQEAGRVIIFQCGNYTPSLAINISALADKSYSSSVPIEELTALINAACE